MVLPQTRKTSRVLDFAGNLETYFGKLFGMQPSNKAEAVCYSMATGIIDNLHSEHLSPWSREKCDIVMLLAWHQWSDTLVVGVRMMGKVHCGQVVIPSQELGKESPSCLCNFSQQRLQRASNGAVLEFPVSVDNGDHSQETWLLSSRESWTLE